MVLKKLKNIRFNISYTKYLFLFTSLTYIVHNLINLDKLTKWFYTNDQFAYFGFVSYVIAGYCLYVVVFALIAQKYTLKAVSLFVVTSSTFISYFILKFNVAMDASMLLNVINTNVTESLPLFSVQMVPYIVFLLVIPAFVILRTNVTYDKPIKQIIKTFLIIFGLLIVTVSLIYGSFKEIHRAGNLSNKYILYSLTPVNILAATIDLIKKQVIIPLFGKSEDNDLVIEAKVTKQQDIVVVLAIGEATRQKNLNIYGYNRVETTPLLSQYKDLHILNGQARLGSTLYAIKEILRKDGIKLTNVAYGADINTSIYSNFTLYNDSNVVPEIKVKNHKYDKTYDEDVVPYLEENLNSYKNGQRLILLHLGGGAHGPIYSYRYPETFKKFLPSCENPDMLNQCTEEERYNAYDNAMLYQDYVIDQVIKTLDNSKVPYVMIFSSDHGESLGEGGYVFHGMPPGMSLPAEQADIAMFVKSSLPIKIKKQDKYTQPEIFDTVLDLLSIETKEFDKQGSFIKIIR